MNRTARAELSPWCRTTACTVLLTVLLMPVVFLASATAARGDYPPEPPPPQQPVHVVATPPPPATPGIIVPPAGRRAVRAEPGVPAEPGVGPREQGGLARTGAEIALYISVGLALIGVGSVLLVAVRTRSRVRRSALVRSGPGDF